MPKTWNLDARALAQKAERARYIADTISAALTPVRAAKEPSQGHLALLQDAALKSLSEDDNLIRDLAALRAELMRLSDD